MATTSSSSVTIDRAYFETLVRRANLVQNGDLTSNRLSGNYDSSLSVVPKAEYEGLLMMSKQYSNLWRNLMAGGVDEETLSLLSESDVAGPQHNSQTSTTIPLHKTEESEDGDVQLGPSVRFSDGNKSYTSTNGVQGPRSYGGGGRHVSQNGSHAERQTGKPSGWADSDSMGDDYMPVQYADSRAPDPSNERPYGVGQVHNHQRPQYPRLCRRTVVFANLPENATHKDITDVVRGGMLLDVFLRATEHVAQVSFLREEDAVRFYDHARKNDVYIRNKRVSLRWAERHFHLPGHVAGKVAVGATRNMIIRRCDPKHTQDSIRDDLEHIHNLVVIDVEFLGGSCYIKTNSVHNAMFARTCMMSRARYKGSKIEWGVDECDQPIESIQRASPKPPQAPPLKKPQASMRNRFATLRLDDDDDETDDTFDSSSEFRSPSTVNVTA